MIKLINIIQINTLSKTMERRVMERKVMELIVRQALDAKDWKIKELEEENQKLKMRVNILEDALKSQSDESSSQRPLNPNETNILSTIKREHELSIG